MSMEVLSVSEITARIKSKLEQDPVLSNASVRGEISNFKLHTSGHAYFTLKDQGAIIRAVMFRGSFGRVNFRPKDGMEVLIKGRISLYEKDGSYQLYAEHMFLGGQGELARAFQQLKEKLEREGLFSPLHKKKIPFLPKRIGIITSETGAAIRDILKVLRDRNPGIPILIYPVQVQGPYSASEICRGIQWFNEESRADVIILGRGGGSMEELWSFNEESVARSIFQSAIPIISAVGHETDFTIADFVADVRAATPSNAAEIAVPERDALLRNMDTLESRLENGLRKDFSKWNEKLQWSERVLESRMKGFIINRGSGLDLLGERLEHMLQRRIHISRERLRNMVGKLDRSFMEELRIENDRIKENAYKLERQISDYVNEKKHHAEVIRERLEALNPEKILQLGYSLVEKENHILDSVAYILVGEELYVHLKDGKLKGKVLEVERWP